MDIFVRDVVDSTITHVLASPRLKARTILSLLVMTSHGVSSSRQTYLPIQQGYILNVRVLDDVHYSWILPDTAHANPMGVIAPQVLHEDVGGIWLGREAIISNVDPCICNLQPVHIK